VTFTVTNLRQSGEFRKGFAAALAWAIMLAILWWVGAWMLGAAQEFAENFWDDERVLARGEKTPSDPDAPDYVGRVRAARARIASFNEDILPHVAREYNAYVRAETWRRRANNCFKHMEQFREAERLTLYPAELLAGIALHESAGCNMGARDAAGGRGWMQLTHITPSLHLRPAAQMLRLPAQQVNYKGNQEHNLLVGIMVLDDYERRLKSREHGLLAYNMGVGGVRRAMRAAGWTAGEPLPTVTDIRPHLRNDRRARPRVYVARVLATAVMMHRLATSKPLTPLKRLRPEDVPGWDPKDDGADRAK
jgi:hypothetical protein